MLPSGLQGHLHICSAHTCTQANTHTQKDYRAPVIPVILQFPTSRQDSPPLLEAVPSSPGTTPHQGTPHFTVLDFPEVFLATCTLSHMVTLVSS